MSMLPESRQATGPIIATLLLMPITIPVMLIDALCFPQFGYFTIFFALVYTGVVLLWHHRTKKSRPSS